MDQFTLNITRQKNFVGAAMPYRICVNGKEVATIKIGGNVSIQIPNQRTILKVSMVGNGMAFHRIEKEVVIFPEYSKSNVINCEIVTKANWFGVFTWGLIRAVGSAVINVNYNTTR